MTATADATAEIHVAAIRAPQCVRRQVVPLARQDLFGSAVRRNDREIGSATMIELLADYRVGRELASIENPAPVRRVPGIGTIDVVVAR